MCLFLRAPENSYRRCLYSFYVDTYNLHHAGITFHFLLLTQDENPYLYMQASRGGSNNVGALTSIRCMGFKVFGAGMEGCTHGFVRIAT